MRRARSVVALALVAALATRDVARAKGGGAGDEVELGRRFFLEARSQLPLVDDPAVVEYVERIGSHLVATLGSQQFDYHFYVVSSRP